MFNHEQRLELLEETWGHCQCQTNLFSQEDDYNEIHLGFVHECKIMNRACNWQKHGVSMPNQAIARKITKLT